MFSVILICIGFGLGYVFRGTRAGVWLSKMLKKDSGVE